MTKDANNSFDEFIQKFLIEKQNFLADKEINFTDISKLIEKINGIDITKSKKETLENIKKLTSDSSINIENLMKNIDKEPNEDKINLNFSGKLKLIIDSIGDDKKDGVKWFYAHILWVWYYMATMSPKNKIAKIEEDCGLTKQRLDIKLFTEGNAGYGNIFQQKDTAIKKIIHLFLNCTLDTNGIGIIDYIKKSQTQAKESIDYIPDYLKNILCHILSPEDYEPIVIQNDKNGIVSAFSCILENDTKNEDVDMMLSSIRKELIKNYELDEGFSFYCPNVRKFWYSSKTTFQFNELQALKYKKQIVLYGPPGTGKTYEANEIAKSIIYQHWIEKGKIKYVLEGTGDLIENKIRHLQLHSNYSYEDFIIGIKLSDNKTFSEEGYFTKLCQEVQKDKESPYVLILDEINRVDLSKLFGEAFSAIEYRGKPIDLSLGNTLNVPKNLYIIGTMNEIDFSLETLDFALRRRFVWFFHGYDKDSLRQIIDSKIEESQELDNEPIDSFISCCTELNKKISAADELGEQYQIGHTFFAEIIDILKQIDVDKWDKGAVSDATNILWSISIKPMIEAFLGNIDSKEKKPIVNQFDAIFKKK